MNENSVSLVSSALLLHFRSFCFPGSLSDGKCIHRLVQKLYFSWISDLGLCYPDLISLLLLLTMSNQPQKHILMLALCYQPKFIMNYKTQVDFIWLPISLLSTKFLFDTRRECAPMGQERCGLVGSKMRCNECALMSHAHLRPGLAKSSWCPLFLQKLSQPLSVDVSLSQLAFQKCP